MKKSNKKVLIAVLVMVASVGFLIYRGLAETSVYYMTVGELKTSALGQKIGPTQAVRVGGLVVDGSTSYNQRDLELRFSLKDENNPQEIIDAVYNGAKPDAFEPEIEALLEGTYDRSKNLFQAETLLVKCPSKYESETEQDNKQEVGK
jgi:cytochrome c-type biogenesis protein CcmE